MRRLLRLPDRILSIPRQLVFAVVGAEVGFGGFGGIGLEGHPSKMRKAGMTNKFVFKSLFSRRGRLSPIMRL